MCKTKNGFSIYILDPFDVDIQPKIPNARARTAQIPFHVIT